MCWSWKNDFPPASETFRVTKLCSEPPRKLLAGFNCLAVVWSTASALAPGECADLLSIFTITTAGGRDFCLKIISIWILQSVVINTVAISMEVSTTWNFKMLITLCISKTRISFLQAPLGRLCQPLGSVFANPQTWSITSPHSMEQKTWTISLLRKGEKEDPASLPTTARSVAFTYEELSEGLCSLCLRRVLGKLSVIRKLQVKSNTKCVCLAVSEDRRHRLDCAESCEVAGYRKRFFDLGSFLVQIQGLFLLTRCWWRWLKNTQVLT